MPGVQTSQTVLYCKMLAVKPNIRFYITDQPSEFLLGHHLKANLLIWGDYTANQVASSKILGTMVTKMVATWSDLKLIILQQ